MVSGNQIARGPAFALAGAARFVQGVQKFVAQKRIVLREAVPILRGYVVQRGCDGYVQIVLSIRCEVKKFDTRR